MGNLRQHLRGQKDQPSLVCPATQLINYDVNKRLNEVFIIKLSGVKKYTIRLKIVEILIKIAGKIAKMKVEIEV